MVEQHIYTSAAFPAALKCQALSFLRVWWPEGFTGPNRLRTWITKESDHPLHVVLTEAGLLISHANVVWKVLDHDGVSYKAYGLTGVFTYPSFRGQGYGARTVAAATAAIRASDADIAMFHCDAALRSFYARHGWESIERATTLIGPPDAPVIVEDELLTMLFLSDKGKQGRRAFATRPIYFGSDSTW